MIKIKGYIKSANAIKLNFIKQLPIENRCGGVPVAPLSPLQVIRKLHGVVLKNKTFCSQKCKTSVTNQQTLNHSLQLVHFMTQNSSSNSLFGNCYAFCSARGLQLQLDTEINFTVPKS